MELDKIIVEESNGEFVAIYGDYEGHGDSRESAIENLIIGLEYGELEGEN